MNDSTLWSVCHKQYFPVRLTIRSEHTRAQYRFAINNFCDFLGRPPELTDLSDDNLAALTHALLAGGMAEITANERVGRLKTLWTWLAKRGRLTTFPTLDRLPTPEKIPRAWTVDELKLLFESCRREPGTIDGVPAGDWWLALHAWLWCTSERKGASLAMTWPMLDLRAGLAVLPASIRKGRNKPAVYCLWPETITALRSIELPRREFVFPWPFHNGTYYNRYSRILRRAGLPVGRAHKTHAMRVSHASWREAMGGDASKSLGHCDPATTRKHYLDPRIVRKDQTQLFWPGEDPPPRAA